MIPLPDQGDSHALTLNVPTKGRRDIGNGGRTVLERMCKVSTMFHGPWVCCTDAMQKA